jgi:proteic killer suppression protein
LTLSRLSHDALRYGAVIAIFGAVIKSFADAESAKVWSGRRSRRLPPDIQPVALRKLRMLNQARSLADLRPGIGSRL